MQALFKEGSMAAPILDNICNLRIHCTTLEDDLVPAVVSLLRGMPNLNSLSIRTVEEPLNPKPSSGFGTEYWKLQDLAFLHQLQEVTVQYSGHGFNEIEFSTEDEQSKAAAGMGSVCQSQSIKVENLEELCWLENAPTSYSNSKLQFCWVLDCVRRVGVLGLNEATVKALYGEGSIPAQFNDIWCLTLNTLSISDDLIPSMVQVQASGFDMEYWKLQNLDFIYQLEEVTIKLTKGSNGIEFARYILEHAEALEKMNIICSPKQSDVIKKLNESKIISDATLTFQEK
ncbi:hypothetical protein Pyn_02698 [Prunus yedoensis var. nudiflora]|uniref:FBD domain-containing protein n=1 Tax=Prunus yedoensis var. nudiflora TaxID=2094558 RepID=A0A314V1I7_PRUYE|nr:hypothetical protein Pyn_02698 [Prunus yedoensis var. nudiflora]